MTREEARLALEAFHRRISERAEALAARLGPRLHCARGCCDCCVDDLTVYSIEADTIVRAFPGVLEEPPAPAGRCAFLDRQGACRIYEARPYVCRTQGLALRRLEPEPEPVEIRDICPRSEPREPGEPPITEWDPGDCWTIGPAEEQLERLQRAFDPDHPHPHRIPLRELLLSL